MEEEEQLDGPRIRFAGGFGTFGEKKEEHP